MTIQVQAIKQYFLVLYKVLEYKGMNMLIYNINSKSKVYYFALCIVFQERLSE